MGYMNIAGTCSILKKEEAVANPQGISLEVTVQERADGGVDVFVIDRSLLGNRGYIATVNDPRSPEWGLTQHALMGSETTRQGCRVAKYLFQSEKAGYDAVMWAFEARSEWDWARAAAWVLGLRFKP